MSIPVLPHADDDVEGGGELLRRQTIVSVVVSEEPDLLHCCGVEARLSEDGDGLVFGEEAVLVLVVAHEQRVVLHMFLWSYRKRRRRCCCHIRRHCSRSRRGSYRGCTC